MATFVWSGAQDTNWFNPNNWRPAIVPGSGSTVVIPTGLANYPVVASGSSLTIGGALTDGDQITLEATNSFTDLRFTGGGTDLLNGGGVILLSDNSDNRIYGVQGGTVLDNVNDTIEGAGQIFSFGGLSIDNGLKGVIDASGVVNALVINSITIANTGLVESTSTGGLDLVGVLLDQSSGGKLSAAGGEIYVSNSTIRGGTIEASGAGGIQTNGTGTTLDGSGALPVTIVSGTVLQVNDGQNLTILGGITNSGTILLDSGQDGVHFDNTDLIVNGGATTTLQGGGVIQMSDSGANRLYGDQASTTLENFDDTIEGAGQIFSNSGNLTLKNDASGVIDATAANNNLDISNITVNNAGLVESTSTGGLVLTGMTLNQSMGGALGASGGNVYFNSSDIIGGTLETSGSSLIETNGTGTQLDGTGTLPITITKGSTVQVNNANNLTIIGVISDSGTILLDSGQDSVHYDNTDLIVNSGAKVTLQGGGAVQLSDSGANRLFTNQGGTTLENVDDLIEGAGQIFSNNGLTIQNDRSGVIEANAATNSLVIRNITVNNTGLVESTSTAGLDLGSMTLNQSSGGTLSAAGGNVYFNGSEIYGGTLETSGSSLIETNGTGTQLDGTGTLPVSITKGSTVQVNDGNNLTIIGVIADSGTILLDSGQNGVNFDNTDLIVNSGAKVTLQGGGTLQLSNSPANRVYSNNAHTTLENVDDLIQGAGQIYSNGGNLTLQNDALGVIEANAAANNLDINNITVNNTGLVESTSTGGLMLASMTLNQSTGGTLSAAGGNVYFNSSEILGGTLETSGTSLIETNGTGTQLDGTGTLPVSITKGSTVQVNDGNNLTIIGVIADSGTILLDSGQDGVHFDNTDLIVNSSAAVKLQGGGTLQLSNSGANRIYSNQTGTTLENVDDLIQGAGQIVSNSGNLTLQNDKSGVINASSATNNLNINTITVNNAGLVESTAASGLILGSMFLNQSTGGTLSAAGGNVYFNASHIFGGTLKSSGSSLIETNGAGTELDGSGGSTLTIASGSTVQVNDGQNLTLAGAIADAGVILLDSGQNRVNFDNTDLLINGAVTLTGGGRINLSNSGANRIYSNTGSSVLTNNDVIAGAGQIFSNGNLTIQNTTTGAINANSYTNALVVTNITINNQGAVESTSLGGLVLGGGANIVQSGAGAVKALTGNVYINSSRIAGGSIQTTGYYLVETNGTGALLDGSSSTLTITKGSNVWVNDGQNLSLAGNIANSGVISLNSGENGFNYDNTDLLIDGAVTLNGGGTILLSNSSANRIFSNQGGSVLTNAGDTIVGAGQIFSNSGNMSLVNGAGGVIEAGAGETLKVELGVANSGTLEANGGLLDVQAAVTGSGVGAVTNGGRLQFDGSASLAAVDFIGPFAGTIVIPGGSIGQTTPEIPAINGFGVGDTLTVGDNVGTSAIQLTYVEDPSKTFGTLTINTVASTINGPVLNPIESFRVNGFYTQDDFVAYNNIGSISIQGVGDLWTGSTQAWSTVGAWTQGVPSANDEVLVSSGSPTISGQTIGTVSTLAVTQGPVNFANSAGNVVTGNLFTSGILSLDQSAGQGGSSVTAGSVEVSSTGTLSIGNATLASNDALTTASVTNLGTIDVMGAAAEQALLNVTGAAGFGTAGALSGTVSLAGDSAIEFASGGLTTIAGSGSLTLSGNLADVELAGKLGSNSALTGLSNVVGQAHLENGAVWAPAGAVFVSGTLGVDDVGGAGGTSLTVPSLYNLGTVSIGNATLAAPAKVLTAALRNNGVLSLVGSANQQALLDVTTGAANFGLSGTLTGTVTLSGDSAIEFLSGSVATISAGASLQEFGPSAYLEDSTLLGKNSALGGLNAVAGVLKLDQGASVGITGPISVSGALTVDGSSAVGGSSLTATGVLTNSGALTLGGASLGAADLVKAGGLSNSGTITLVGSAAKQALLNVTAAAGFGTAGVLMGSVNLSGDSAIEFASASIATIASNSTLTMAGPSAFIEDSTKLGANSALSGLANVSGTLALDNMVTIASTAALTVSGTLTVDTPTGEGSSSLSTTGKLSNTGSITLGSASLAASDTIKAGSLSNIGHITLIGAGNNQALLNVGGAAGFGTAGVLTGTVLLAGDSAIEFAAAGSVASIAAGSLLVLQGPTAFIEAAASPGANSALTGLTTISGELDLHNGAIIASTKPMTISTGGVLTVDATSADGGSNLTTTSSLTNNGALAIGNAKLSSSDFVAAASINNTGGAISLTGNGAFQAFLHATASAAGFGAAGQVLGSVSLVNDSAIEFQIGTVSTIAHGASLSISGSNAFVENAAGLGANSALTGLATIAGSLTIENGVTIASTAAITNSGTVGVDSPATGGAGGSTLKTTSSITNSGSLSIGNSGITSNELVQATTLNNTGTLTLNGSGTASTLLNLTAGAGIGAAGSVSGAVYVGLNSAIELAATAAISTIIKGATLELGAGNAYIEDSGALGSNSALKSLTTVSGTLLLDLNASIASGKAITNTGIITLDGAQGGGASLSTTGALANSGTITVGAGLNLNQTAQISAASLSNTGTITLWGGVSVEVAMNVGGAAGFGSAGVLTGDVNLIGNSQIDFGGGGITTVASTAILQLNGSGAEIQSATAPVGTNSALDTLTVLNGQVDLYNGASASLQNNLSIAGALFLDSSPNSGGSHLSDAGAITNNGTLNLGNTSEIGGSNVTTNGLVNDDFIDLTGNGGSGNAELNVTGAFTNSGDVALISDSETLNATVGGTGGFDIWNGSTLTFGTSSSVGSGQTVTFDTSGALDLGQTSSFQGTIAGFGSGNTMDLTAFQWATGDTWLFNANSGGAGGQLELFQGGTTPTATLQMTGVYTTASFNVVSDSSGKGALISFV